MRTCCHTRRLLRSSTSAFQKKAPRNRKSPRSIDLNRKTTRTWTTSPKPAMRVRTFERSLCWTRPKLPSCTTLLCWWKPVLGGNDIDGALLLAVVGVIAGALVVVVVTTCGKILHAAAANGQVDEYRKYHRCCFHCMPFEAMGTWGQPAWPHPRWCWPTST